MIVKLIPGSRNEELITRVKDIVNGTSVCSGFETGFDGENGTSSVLLTSWLKVASQKMNCWMPSTMLAENAKML